MSSEYERATVDRNSDESKGRLQRTWDTLQNTLTQTVETVTRQSRFEISGGAVDQIDAPDDLDELVDLAKDVGFVWRSYQVFANEVWEQGYRLEGPDETVAYFMGDSEELDATPPEDTPEGGFLTNAAVFAGEKHQDFSDLGKASTFQRRLRGTVLVELLKANEEDPESEITGFYLIRPETVSAEVYPNTNILIDPEDTDQSGVEITKRGEAAAYIQFDDNSILGRKGRFNDDKDEIPLSQNDVHKQVLSPGIGDDTGDEQGVFGTPGMEPISEDIAEYKQIKRDRARAIQTKAYGIWAMEYDREVLDLGNGQKEIIEWDDDDMDDDLKTIEGLGPGDIAQHDGSKTLKKFDSDVPDLDDTLKHYVDDIFAGLPVSKYKVGFADDINRDVTSEQSDTDTDLVKEEREYQERQWTKVLRTVAKRKDLPTDGLRLKIEPEPQDSPVMSLSTEEMDKLATYADALNSLAGPAGGPQTLVDTETLLTDVAQLPESVSSVDEVSEAMGEVDQDTQAAFMDAMGMDEQLDPLQAGEGDVVELPSGGKGVVVMEGGEDVEIDGETVEDGEVVVAYASRQGYTIIDASELGEASFDVPDDVDPEEVTDAMAHEGYAEVENPYDPMSIDVLVGTGIGFDSWPDSWEEADTPARIIALDAWSSMGGTWRGCFAEIGDAEICSAFKDEMLGTTEWR